MNFFLNSMFSNFFLSEYCVHFSSYRMIQWWTETDLECEEINISHMNKCNYNLLCILNICSLPCERQYNEVDCRVILYWGIRVDTRIRLLRFKFCCQFWYLRDFRKIMSLTTHFLNEDGNSNLLYMVGVDIKRLFMQKISIM